jgi:hypothetical protein
MDMGSMGIGVAIGLGLAASGWTATKIVKYVEAKIASLEADTAHTKAVTSVVAGSSLSAAAPVVMSAAPVATPAPAA